MIENPDPQPGFNNPEPASDHLVLALREKYGVPDPASLEDIEPVVMRLLEEGTQDHQKIFDATDLVLNRSVDSSELEVTMIMFAPGVTPRDRFGLLLVRKTTERLKSMAQDQELSRPKTFARRLSRLLTSFRP